MLGRFRCLTTLTLLALPVAACAEGVDFTVPDHYQVAVPAPAAVAQLPAKSVYRDWVRTVDGVRHSIVVSSTPYIGDLPKLMDATVERTRARGALDVVREDVAPQCGMPVTRHAYAYANQLTYEFRYMVVRARLLVASYAHPRGTAPDQTALAALGTLCSGVHQIAGPPGWTLQTPFPNNGSAFRAPDGGSLLAQFVAPAPAGSDVANERYDAPGTVVSDRHEACGAVTIHRVTTSTSDGKTREFAAGTVRGYQYTNAYVRPADAALDAAALATITSFCVETASSAPQPSPTP